MSCKTTCGMNLSLPVRSALLLSFCVLAGCSFKLFSAQEYKTYVLRAAEIAGDSPGEGQQGERAGSRILIITDTTSPSYLAGQKLLFRENARELVAYQYSAWAEPPPRQITRALEHILRKHGGFAAIIRPSTGVRADLQLNTALIEFYHDAQTKPGFAVMAVEVELVDLASGSVLGKQLFTERMAVEQFDATGAIAGLDRATTEILGKIAAWVSATS